MIYQPTMKYQAYQVKETINQDKTSHFRAEILTLETQKLSIGEVLIEVKYSALNYKDTLSYTGNKGVTRKYPHTPGVDASGIVIDSQSPDYQKGDLVLVSGYDFGMNTNGAFAQYVKVPKEWIIKLSPNIDQVLFKAAALGTAAITAGIAIDKLVKNGMKKGEEVLLTGTSGGVGSFCINILNKMGYKPIALIRDKNKEEFLKKIGALGYITQLDLSIPSSRPLLKPVYKYAFDVVGGELLVNILKLMKNEGSVAICGLVASPIIETSIFPFILRGVSLLGVDSVEVPISQKQSIIDRVLELDLDYDSLCTIENIKNLDSCVQNMLKGNNKGRVVFENEF